MAEGRGGGRAGQGGPEGVGERERRRDGPKIAQGEGERFILAFLFRKILERLLLH
jgi:hypothetical protein